MTQQPYRPEKGKMNWIQGSRFRTNKGNYRITTVMWSGGEKESYTIQHQNGEEKVIPAAILESQLTFENYLGL